MLPPFCGCLLYMHLIRAIRCFKDALRVYSVAVLHGVRNRLVVRAQAAILSV